jgi:hypothetical protein
MHRKFYLGSLLVIPAVAFMLATVPGCPNKEGKTSPVAKTGGAGSDTVAADKKGGKAEAFLVKATDGTIKGRVVYDGTPPVMPDIKAMAASGDKAQCHAGDADHPYRHKEQTWIVGKDHGVANTLVFLEAPGGKFFAMDEAEAKKFDHKDAVIDQPYCVFEPHVVAAFAAYRDKDNKLHETGAKLLVKNSGQISHNTKSDGDGKRDAFNKPANPDSTDTIKLEYSPKRILDIACDKHNWMSAKLVTLDHPFFAVTDKDGNFEIKNVPTGVDLTLKTWHEDAADVKENVNVKSGETATKELKIKQKSAS